MTPKISIVVPVYNVEQYLAQCLDSIISQTLSDIEVIVVNDGSTDGSLAIAQDYASKDSRIILIDKPNAGYGHSMNCGFKRANGEYIGIVESDDCARPEMFERLYEQATRHKADAVRSNYFVMSNEGRDFGLIDILSLAHAPYYTSIDPKDYPDILRGSPAIWTTIYRSEFIRENNITFLETPGASYQDTGFILKVFAAATNVILMREAFLNYRIDNAGSSVKSGAKVFCVCDEYASFEEFVSKRPDRARAFRFMIPAKKYETYLWNYNRLDSSLKAEFLFRMTEEFARYDNEGNLDKALFTDEEWCDLQAVIADPDSVLGSSLTVSAPRFDELSHRQTLCVNGEMSHVRYIAWRLKHVFDSLKPSI